MWTVRCRFIPLGEGVRLCSLAGGSIVPGEGLDTVIFIRSFFLLMEAKTKWKKKVCEACIVYKELCLVFYLLQEIVWDSDQEHVLWTRQAA